ncbi:MAG: hypothetical protein UX09_C0015G0022 [Candidatus Uhrbacteria bacterium GW2011_GWE2_45_35]|uniref:Uncharacterized protein n=2 Tax=Candidatus Uhriibacteriota TaxID=1752732 RepID=A0A0G1JJ36_9BACT|nr:MAG: hypothetical protein UW63_C0017G0018 [Candidatus Uhrbacteria bacterium GW2011_GWF2_44_350]KKU08635.1 MAG: hypothetical protein UX09_C0015G0022 [Candidatus Uhrbacteria bacterium GW2011_GWE2_45_35]HBR80284.1 hypothetical protein [Candidatus Uhrbacteria bacterium]HCU31586.1 hypothetical protein [Candidatus Uhrbacteria bacterium]
MSETKKPFESFSPPVSGDQEIRIVEKDGIKEFDPRNTEKKEAALFLSLHRSLSENLRITGREIPRWAMVGLAVGQLFSVETAAASETVEALQAMEVPELRVNLVEDLNPPDTEQAEALGEFLETGVLFQTDGGKLVAIQDDLQEGKTFEFSEPVDQILLERQRPVSEIQELVKTSGWETRSEGGKNQAVKFVEEFRGNGNNMLISESWSDGESQARELILVYPRPNFEDKFSQSDHGVLSVGLFEVGQNFRIYLGVEPLLKPVEEIDGVPVYARDKIGERTFVNYNQQLLNGVQETFSDFGLSPKDCLDRIFIRPGHEVLLKGGWGGLAFTERGEIDFPEDPYLSIAGESFQEIVEHETIHIIGNALKADSSTDWIYTYAIVGPEAMLAMSDAFFPMSGEHPQDNYFEFFATLVNSLDLPNWEQSAETLDGPNRAALLLSLESLRKVLLDHQVKAKAGIIQKIDTKILWCEANKFEVKS